MALSLLGHVEMCLVSIFQIAGSVKEAGEMAE
jgi:hypothetical protein